MPVLFEYPAPRAAKQIPCTTKKYRSFFTCYFYVTIRRKAMYSLASLEMLRAQLGLAASDSSEDTRLLRALEAASLSIESKTQRRFIPRLATILHSIDPRKLTELALREDLLELQSVTNGDGSSISLSDIQHLNNGALRLLNGAVFVYEESPEESVQVRGIWGYHPNWAKAWLNSGDTVQNNPLSSTATSLTVLDADAGNPPRFQLGQLLRIESEYLRVTAINSSTNVLTVERGAEGTTAVTHVLNTAIAIYQLPEDIALLAIRWALWLYREADDGYSEIPAAFLDVLSSLRRVRV
jgi:hypothetical protein